MEITKPIFLSDSVDRLYGSHHRHSSYQLLASNGNEFYLDKRNPLTIHRLNGVSVRAIYDPPFLYMTKMDTFDSSPLDSSRDENPLKYFRAGNAQIIIPSSVFPMFRSEMNDGDRLVVSTRTLKFKYQVTEVNNSGKNNPEKKEITGKATFFSEEPANSNEIEYFKSLVKIQVLRPTDPAFIDNMFEKSIRDLIFFLDKAYPCKDELLDNHESGKQTLLTTAMQRQQWALCFKLLEQGASPDAGHHGESMTPLHMAAKAGQPDLLEALLIHNADPNMTTEPRAHNGTTRRLTPLNCTLLYKSKDKEEGARVRKSMIQTLLESGADPMTIDIAEIADFIEPLELMLEILRVESIDSIKHTRTRQKYQRYLAKVIADQSRIRNKLESDCICRKKKSNGYLLRLLDRLTRKADAVPKLQNACRAIIRPELNFPILSSIKDLNIPWGIKKIICGRDKSYMIRHSV